MRGRRTEPLTIAPQDRATLGRLARADARPWATVRRARIVLALAGGEPPQSIAARMECDEATVWRTRRRYEASGADGLTTAARPGRPPRISPPPAGADRRPGLPGAGGRGSAHHPLVEP